MKLTLIELIILGLNTLIGLCFFAFAFVHHKRAKRNETDIIVVSKQIRTVSLIWGLGQLLLSLFMITVPKLFWVITIVAMIYLLIALNSVGNLIIKTKGTPLHNHENCVNDSDKSCSTCIFSKDCKVDANQKVS